MKRLTALFLVLAAFLSLFTACGKDEIPDSPAELWVVTELTDKYGMNDQAERMIERFNELYPEVTVKLDILPTEKEERAVYLQKLRTQIMGGAGPDAYLLPTSNWVPDETHPYYSLVKEVEPLFRDVSVAMDNGVFYDISKYYDRDDALEKEELNASVMDGGMLGDYRFVLPLRYDLGVYLVDRENLEAQGFDISILQGGTNDLMAAALNQGNVNIAYTCIPTYFEWYFSDLIDYTSSSVLLTAEEVAEFMRNYQAVIPEWIANGTAYTATQDHYVDSGTFFAADGGAVKRVNLCSTMGAIATAKVVGEEVEMYPMLAPDGTLNACINYYAAVGAGSEHPRLAYEFIRLFLSEEAQYESYFSDGKYRNAWDSAGAGWPVRTVGSVEPRFETLQYQCTKQDYVKTAKRKAQYLKEDLTMTDEDVPALTWQVDEARFPILYEYEDTISYYLTLLCDAENGYAPTDVDIDALAQQYIDNLQLYLDEG